MLSQPHTCAPDIPDMVKLPLQVRQSVRELQVAQTVGQTPQVVAVSGNIPGEQVRQVVAPVHTTQLVMAREQLKQVPPLKYRREAALQLQTPKA